MNYIALVQPIVWHIGWFKNNNKKILPLSVTEVWRSISNATAKRLSLFCTITNIQYNTYDRLLYMKQVTFLTSINAPSDYIYPRSFTLPGAWANLSWSDWSILTLKCPWTIMYRNADPKRLFQVKLRVLRNPIILNPICLYLLLSAILSSNLYDRFHSLSI